MIPAAGYAAAPPASYGGGIDQDLRRIRSRLAARGNSENLHTQCVLSDVRLGATDVDNFIVDDERRHFHIDGEQPKQPDAQLRAVRRDKFLVGEFYGISCEASLLRSSAPESTREPSDEDGRERSDRHAIVIKKFSDLPEYDRRNVIRGAI